MVKAWFVLNHHPRSPSAVGPFKSCSAAWDYVRADRRTASVLEAEANISRIGRCTVYAPVKAEVGP